MKNADIAAAFDELGTLYELDGAVVYRVLAYRNAAKAIRDSGVSVAELARQGRAEELAGIGNTIAEKIVALLDEGEIPAARKLKAKIPEGLVMVTRIPGLGPKRARQLHDQLGIDSIESLRAAAEAQQIRTVAGFGAKAEEKILAALAAGADGSVRERVLLSVARDVGGELVEGLRASGTVEQVELAGSARRWADTCKDLDIVAAVSAATAATPAPRPSPIRGWLSICASSGATASAACCSTSPARAATTRRCGPPRSSRACTSASTASSTTKPARRCAARPRRPCTSASGWPIPSPSCARTAASWRPGSRRRS